jgi:uncharacterized protein
MMSLKETLRNDMANAMRIGNTEKRDALRMIMAAIKQVEVDEQVELGDSDVQSILNKQAKQRRESITEYENAGRQELAAVEKSELAIIETYLPQLMSREEVYKIASNVIAELGVTDAKGMGQIMGKLMPKVKGKADGRIVNEVVREILQNL